MLILARRMNERIIIDDDIEVSILDIKGDQVKIGIRAPKNVKVYRQEVFEAIQEENRRAAETSSRELPSLDAYLKDGDTPASEDT
jgi:carbon storage regulator